MILNELKGKEAFSRAGWMDHCRTAVCFQHGKHRLIGSSIVRVKLQPQRPFLFHHIIGIMYLLYITSPKLSI